MEPIRIRPATSEDLPTLLRFEQEIIRAERPMDSTIREDPVTYYDLKAMLRDEDATVRVAVHGDRVIGSGFAVEKMARAYLDHAYYAYLGFMYTEPEYRGMGVNKSIIDSLMAWAASRGLRELRLTVYDPNTPAIRAYEKVGFRRHLLEMRLRQDFEPQEP